MMSREKANQRIDQSIALYKKQKSPRKYAIILLSFAAFLAVGLLLYFTIGEELLSSRGQVVTLQNRDDILYGNSSETESDTHYEVVMASQWTFADGRAKSADAYVENSTVNTNAVFFTVTLSDSEEIVYVSPRLNVGTYVADFALSVPLDRGEYDAILTYYLLNDNDECISTIPMKLHITIEK